MGGVSRCGRFAGALSLAASISVAQGAAPAVPAQEPQGAWTVDRLVLALRAEAGTQAPSPAVRADFERLARDHSLPTDAVTLDAYLRVKLVFEATREAGWWRLGWVVTNREPTSDAIWAEWRRIRGRVPRITAVAECDESAALAAFLLRRLGIPSVGLLWPQANHTVAVWKTARREGGLARIVLPTSQIFLDPQDGLDTRAFDVRVQRQVYDYVRADIDGNATLPAGLASFFLTQVRRYALASDSVQRRLRVLRSRWMAGESGQALEAERAALEAECRQRQAPAADVAAVAAFRQEMADAGSE